MGGSADWGRTTLHMSSDGFAVSNASPSLALETPLGGIDAFSMSDASGATLGASASGWGVALAVSAQPVPETGTFSSSSVEATTVVASGSLSVDSKGYGSVEIGLGARAGASASTQRSETTVRYSTRDKDQP